MNRRNEGAEVNKEFNFQLRQTANSTELVTVDRYNELVKPDYRYFSGDVANLLRSMDNIISDED